MDTAWHLDRATPVPESGCWIWLGAEKGNGYGNVRQGGRNITAHRAAYERVHGPVPSDVDVCHKCDTRQCINPDHLFLGSRAENMGDAKRKGRLSVGPKHSRLICGERSSGAKLGVAQVAAIRRAAKDGAKPKDLAEVAGVSADNIRRIVRHDTWKELDQCAV